MKKMKRKDNTRVRRSNGVEILYPEVLSHIFHFLNIQDRGRASAVCKLWYEVSHEKRIWRGVEATLHLKSHSNNGLWTSLFRRGITRVQVLSLKRSLRDLVTGLPSITSLKLSGCYSVTDATLNSAFSPSSVPTAVPQLAHLVTLDLSLCKQITDLSLARISRASPNLKTLELGGCCQISDRGLLLVAWGLRNLCHLNLRSCYLITDTGIGFLTGLVTPAHLQESKFHDFLLKLNLLSADLIRSPGKGSRIHSRSAKSLSKLPSSPYPSAFSSSKRYRLDSSQSQCSICHKDIGDGRRKSGLSNEKLKRKSPSRSLLGEVPYLPKIELTTPFGTRALQSLGLQDCQKLTDISLGHIGGVPHGLPALESINLSFCINLSDGGLRQLAQLPHVTEINLRSCDNITNTGLQNLRDLGSTLRSLDISFCDKVRNTGLTFISSSLTNIRTLSLSATEIGDSGLIQLANVLTHLTVLNLGQCTKITDESLKVIAEKCTRIEFIDLYGCTNISRQGLNLILQMPRIKKLNLGLWSTS